MSESELNGSTAVADPMSAMMGQLMNDDPRLRMFAELMRARSAAADATAAPSAEEVLERLRAQHERLRAAYVSVRERDEALAAALGACPACWGERPSCRYCRGEGSPGAFMPDWELFSRYIMPAVRQRASLTRTRAGTEPANPQEE